jgi:hypothetical protein
MDNRQGDVDLRFAQVSAPSVNTLAWLWLDLKSAVLLKQVEASRSFDSGASYRLLSLALVQAVA